MVGNSQINFQTLERRFTMKACIRIERMDGMFLASYPIKGGTVVDLKEVFYSVGSQDKVQVSIEYRKDPED